VLTFSQFLICSETLDSDIIDKVQDWKNHGWNRATLTALAKKAVKGGPLHHLHPGKTKVYRGVTPTSAHHAKVGTSWSKAKTVAKRYADDDGKVHAMKISPHVPAIDVNKVMKGIPSKSTKDREVFVAKGKYKTDNISETAL
jgi:hypothetical protein